MYGQAVVDAMEIRGHEVGKMTDAAAKEFAKWFRKQKRRCIAMSKKLRRFDATCLELKLA